MHMVVTREYLLSLLPPDQDTWVVVKKKQEVRDIIKELVNAYPSFTKDYDKIGWCFNADTLEEITDNLYGFCVNNIKYEAESEDWQSSALPGGILTRGFGDCKAYASFIGGCLGAISRATGDPIDWAFRFVSYDPDIRTPYHVFVVVFTPQGEIWVDPTPGTATGKPLYPVTKKVDETMALMRQIAGVSVDGSGQLVTRLDTVGASSTTGLNIPAGTIPLPSAYPAGTPQPYVVEGKIKFYGVPPNFTPSETQVAWMLLALQAWVDAYGKRKYNVFTYTNATDGTGFTIADMILNYCELYGSYEMLHVDDMRPDTNPYDNPFSTLNNMINTRKLFVRSVRDFDFGNPPTYTPSSFEKTMDALMNTVAIAVLNVAASYVPVAGPIFAKAFTNAMAQDAISHQIYNAAVAQAAQGIVTADATTTAAVAAAAKQRRLKQALIALTIGLGLWVALQKE